MEKQAAWAHRFVSKAPLLNRFRRRLSRPQAPEKSPLRILRPSDQGEPLIFIHPFGGSVLCYGDLVACLGDEPDFPIYGLEASGEEPVAATVEEMARGYLRSISDIATSAPCHLAGWSFGGILAFEMAKQLHDAKNPAASVTLIDAGVPPMVGKYFSSPPALAARALGINVTPDMIGGGGKLTREWMVAAARHTGSKHVLRPDSAASLIKLAATLLKVYAAYRPGILRGSLTCLRASSENNNAHECGWEKHVAGKTTVMDIWGSQESIVTRPAVEQVAAILKETMRGKSIASPENEDKSLLTKCDID
jgi:thioesterase domain-containing protein